MKGILVLKTIVMLCISMFVLTGCGGSNIGGVISQAGSGLNFGSPGTSIISGDFTPSFNIEKEENLLNNYLEGTELTFVDTSTPGNLSIERVSWSFGDGASSTERTVKHSYVDNGRYKVTLTIYNGETEEKVSKLIDIYKIVEGGGKVDFDIDESSTVVGGSPTDGVYKDHTAHFSYSGESDVSELLWSFGDDTSISSQSQEIEHKYRVAFTPIKNYEVKLYAADSVSKEIYTKTKQFQFKFERYSNGGRYKVATHSAYYALALQSESLDADNYYLAVSKDLTTPTSSLFALDKTFRTKLSDFNKNNILSLDTSEKALFQDTTTYLRSSGEVHFPEDAIFDFGDGTVIKASEDSENCKISPSAYPVCEYSYEEVGSYTIKVTSLYQTLGKIYTEEVAVKGYSLVADFNTDIGYIIPTGQAASFTDVTDYTDLRAKNRVWDFGDGNDPIVTSSDFIPYFFHTPGSYDISFTVNTEEGYSDTVTRRILVKQLEIFGKIRLDFSPNIAFVNEPITLKSKLELVDIDDESFEGYWEYREDENLDNPPISSEFSTLLDSPIITFTTRGYHKVKQIVANSLYLKSIEKNVLVMENEADFGNNSGGLISPILIALKDTLYIGSEATYDLNSKIGNYDFIGTTSVNPIIRNTWKITSEDGSVLVDIVSDEPTETQTFQHDFQDLGKYKVEACAIDNLFYRDCSTIYTYVVDNTEVEIAFVFDENHFNRRLGVEQTISAEANISEDPDDQPNLFIEEYIWELKNLYINRPIIKKELNVPLVTHTFTDIKDIGNYEITLKYKLSTGQEKTAVLPVDQTFSIYREDANLFSMELELLNFPRVNSGVGFSAKEDIVPTKGDSWRWQFDSEEPFITDSQSIIKIFENDGSAENIGTHNLIAESIDYESYLYTKANDFPFEVYTDQKSEIDLSIEITKVSAGGDFTATDIGFLDYAPEINVNNKECVTYNFKAITSSDNIDEYKWFFGDGDIETITDKEITHKYCIPETYKPILSIVDNNRKTKSVSTVLGINHTTSLDGRCPIALLTRLLDPTNKVGVGELVYVYQAIVYSCGYKKYQLTWGAINSALIPNTHGNELRFRVNSDYYDLKLSAIDTGGNYAYHRHRYSVGGSGNDPKSVDPAPKGFYIPYQNYIVRDPAPRNVFGNEGDFRARGIEWRWYTSLGGAWGLNYTTLASPLSGTYWILSDYYHLPSESTLGYQEAGGTSIRIYPALMFCSIGNEVTKPKVEVYNFNSRDAAGFLNQGYTLNFNGEPQGYDCSIDSDQEHVYYQSSAGEGRTRYNGDLDINNRSGNISKIVKLDDLPYRNIDINEGYINYNGKVYLSDYNIVGIIYYPPYNKYILEIYDAKKKEVVLYLASWDEIKKGEITKLPFEAFKGVSFDKENASYRGVNMFLDDNSKIVLGLPTGTFVLEVLESFTMQTLRDIHMVSNIKTNDGYLMTIKNNEDDNYPTKIIGLKGQISTDPSNPDVAFIDNNDYVTYYNGLANGDYDGLNNGITGLRYLR